MSELKILKAAHADGSTWFACGIHVGTPTKPHQWVAGVKDRDHGPVLWRGTAIHTSSTLAIEEAERALDAAAAENERTA